MSENEETQRNLDSTPSEPAATAQPEAAQPAGVEAPTEPLTGTSAGTVSAAETVDYKAKYEKQKQTTRTYIITTILAGVIAVGGVAWAGATTVAANKKPRVDVTQFEFKKNRGGPGQGYRGLNRENLDKKKDQNNEQNNSQPGSPSPETWDSNPRVDGGKENWENYQRENQNQGSDQQKQQREDNIKKFREDVKELQRQLNQSQ